MWTFRKEVYLYVYSGSVDMRKSINGLSALVFSEMEMEPQSGDVVVFHNKQNNKIKVLHWDRNGFVLHYKRLEKGRFKFNASFTEGYFSITQDQFSWLFAGLDFMLMNEFKELNFSHYF